MANQLRFPGVVSLLIGLVSNGLFADSKQECPFKLHRDTLVFVEGAAGGIGKLSLLVDTGASVTIVDSHLAKRLTGETTSCGAAGLLSHDEEVRETWLSDLNVGPVHIDEVHALVVDLSRMELGRKVDIIVGLDVLSREAFTIDYRRKRLSWTESTPLSETAQLTSVYPLLIVAMGINDQVLHLAVDTGAVETVLFEGCLEKVLSKSGMIDRTALRHAQGVSFASRIELRRVSLGEYLWKRFPVIALRKAGPEGLELDGLLSLRSLGAERIHLDAANRLLSWDH